MSVKSPREAAATPPPPPLPSSPDTSLVVSLYVVLVLALTTVCVLLAPETSQIDLHADPVDEPAQGQGAR